MLCATFFGETKLINKKIKIISFSAVVLSILINFFFINKFIDKGHSEPWREVAQDLEKYNKNGDKKVHAVMNLHFNYYLKKYKLQNSTQYSKPEKEESFWYLETSYDESPPSFDKNFKVLERIKYDKKFVLTHYQSD